MYDNLKSENLDLKIWFYYTLPNHHPFIYRVLWSNTVSKNDMHQQGYYNLAYTYVASSNMITNEIFNYFISLKFHYKE